MLVTYYGWPRFYYDNDKAVGDTTGENKQSIWFVITPEGVQKYGLNSKSTLKTEKLEGTS
jgi:hypothetical protein